MKKKIIDYLNELIPNPMCELNYNKDYELLLAVMLSARTTDKRVNIVTKELFNKYPTLKDLSEAKIEDIKTIIKSVGTYNKKALNIINISKSLVNLNKVPNDRSVLENLPGVGRKTANVVLGILYNEGCIAVDTHVSRVAKRLSISKASDDVLITEKKLTSYFKGEDIEKIGNQILLFGRYYCKSQNPLCLNCKLKEFCNYKSI